MRLEMVRPGGDRPRVVACRDRLLAASTLGRIAVRPRRSMVDVEDVALLDAPGVDRLTARVAAGRAAVDEVTGRRNRVAVVSGGSEFSGAGAAGGLAALPAPDEQVLATVSAAVAAVEAQRRRATAGAAAGSVTGQEVDA